MGFRILLDSYVAGNFGDDLLISMIAGRYPEHDFYVMCDEPYLTRFGSMDNVHAVGEISSDEYPLFRRAIDKVRLLAGFPRMGFSRVLRYQNFDMYLLFGGSLFIEEPSLTARGRRGEIRMGVRKTRVSGIMNCNFGPYSSKSFVGSYRGIFEKMDFLSFRESQSFDLFGDIAMADYGADISLDLNSEVDATLWDMNTDYSEGSSVMSIFPISLRGRGDLASQEQRYLGLIEGLARNHLSDAEGTVVILPCCEAEGDMEACRQIAQRLSDFRSRVHVVVPRTVPEIVGRIAKSSVVVGSRFHSVCVALAARVPVYALSYSSKIDNMLTDIGLCGNCIDIKDIDNSDSDSFGAIVSTVAAREKMLSAGNQFGRFEAGLELLC